MSMCLHLRFGTFKSNSPGAKESFCVLAWLSGDDVAECFDLYDSVEDFLEEYSDPFEFLLSLEAEPTLMLENAENYCDPETGDLTNIIAEGWPWANNAEGA